MDGNESKIRVSSFDVALVVDPKGGVPVIVAVFLYKPASIAAWVSA